ncbi:MAG: UTP--glucose-1-phosphate uridylyltransferase [Halanaerobiaceae bacterium]
MKEIKKAVIPVAGLGTRLLPVTKSQPKEMLPLGRKPCVQRIVEEIAGTGLSDILFITGDKKRSIEDHFDIDQELRNKLQSAGKDELLSALKFDDMNVDFYYTRQRIPAGLGDAINYANGFVTDEPFVVALGDAVIETEDHQKTLMERMKEVYQKEEPAFVVAVRKVNPEDVTKYGIVDIKENNSEVWQINDLVEKPAIHEAPSNYAIAARYIFSSDIFGFLDKTLPGSSGEIQLTDAMRMMLKHGHKALAVPLSENEIRHDIGTFDSYFKSFIEFALNDKEYGYKVRQYLESIVDNANVERRE